VVLLGIWGWTARGAYFAYLGDRWWSAATAFESRIQKTPGEASDEEYGDLIAAAEGASQNEPSNVTYAYWLNFYRWESLSRGANSETGQVVLSGDTRPVIVRIADELAAARRICPTYGPPYALEGQLRLFMLKQSGGAELIRKGARLAPYDAPTCLVAGKLAARKGMFDEAVALFKRAVDFQPLYFREVVELCLTEWKRPDLARSLAGNSYD